MSAALSARVGVFKIPTDSPESDGTLAWNSTTMIVVELSGGGETGMGYTYAHPAAALILKEMLPQWVEEHGAEPAGVPNPASPFKPLRAEARQASFFAGGAQGGSSGAFARGSTASEIFGGEGSPGEWLRRKRRNDGKGGIVAMAASAVDVAWWDVRARLAKRSIVDVLGRVRDACPVYGSGGFCSYSHSQLQKQFEGWAEAGITSFKMKVGREQDRDPARVAVARSGIGLKAELFVDANEAYSRPEAVKWASRFAGEWRVTWLEEPIDHEDVAGLRSVRADFPKTLDLAEGEYAYGEADFRRYLEAKAIDVLMPDATRCGGVSGFMQAAALAAELDTPISSHCGPSLHAYLGCAAPHLRHAEYFHDHARVEGMLLEGAPVLKGGALHPPLDRAGFGWIFKWAEAERFALR